MSKETHDAMHARREAEQEARAQVLDEKKAREDIKGLRKAEKFFGMKPGDGNLSNIRGGYGGYYEGVLNPSAKSLRDGRKRAESKLSDEDYGDPLLTKFNDLENKHRGYPDKALKPSSFFGGGLRGLLQDAKKHDLQIGKTENGMTEFIVDGYSFLIRLTPESLRYLEKFTTKYPEFQQPAALVPPPLKTEMNASGQPGNIEKLSALMTQDITPLEVAPAILSENPSSGLNATKGQVTINNTSRTIA